ncbi:MAG TPA: TetR/AcrR family transcriptional regulator [Anaerolineales bacterium]|nr:TetR/AcrR family transcriptional regulator [Anaerolineales bacterium]
MQRSDIIQAAAQIFRQKGYHGTSMQDIADAVHLQKASLYHHISGKQEILVDILDRALDLLIEDIETVAKSDIKPEEKVLQAMQAYVGRLTEDTDLAAVLMQEHRSLADDLQDAHIARRDRLESLWRQIIKEGIKSGDFRHTDEVIATFALLGVLNWMITWYQPGGRLSAQEIANQFGDIFLNGLWKGKVSTS